MATVSFRETFAQLPGGAAGPERTWADVSRYLWRCYLGNEAEKHRIAKFAERQRLYLGAGESDLAAVVDKLFKDPEVRTKHKELVEYAKYNNVLRRIIHEQATVYSMPATRSVGVAPEKPTDGDEASLRAYEQALVDYDELNRRYQEVLRLSRFHEVMQRFNALLLLHRAVVIRPRMRQLPDGAWVPTIDLVTPSKFHAVRSPIDSTLCLALIFETDFVLADEKAAGPKWELLTWHERAWLNSSGHVMDRDADGKSLIDEHNLGRIPAILATIDPPDGKLLDESTGDELVAAQKAVTFLQVRLLKEAKSATKQMVVTGDLARAQRNQSQDIEFEHELPADAAAQMHDRAMDFLAFDTAAERVTDAAAANQGIAPVVMRQGVASSADARELARVPLRERRLQQHVPLREIERDLAALLATIVKQRRPDLAFSADGWNIDFADPQTPLGSKEALDVLEKELQLGLTSELGALMDRNPDLSYDQAKQALLQFILDRTFRMEAMADFMRASGGLAQGAMPEGIAQGDGGTPFAVGDSVTVKPGKEHDPSHRGMKMTVAEVRGDTYALKMPDGSIHRWYTADELIAARMTMGSRAVEDSKEAA